MELKITVHDVDEGELTDEEMYGLSQVVHRFIQEDTAASTSSVEASFVESGGNARIDGEAVSKANLGVEVAADRIPDEWDVRQGEGRGEQIVFTLDESENGTDPTTAISILAATEDSDAEWFVEVQDVDGTRNMGTFLPVAELTEFDDLCAAYERAIECAYEYGTVESDQELLMFEVYGIDPADFEHAWNVGQGNSGVGYDHEAHEAATLVMNALRERFEWAKNIEGVSMGAH